MSRMKKVKLSKKLEKFLKKEGVLEKAISNISINVDEGETFNRIGQMFIWENTEEGHNFWMDLSYKFII